MPTKSEFSKCLILLMEERGLKQTQVAVGAGINPGYFSSILSGERSASAESAGSIARVFEDPDDQAEIMEAWLLDKVIEAGFEADDLRKFAAPEYPGLSIPVGLAEHIEILVKHAQQFDSTRELITNLAKSLRSSAEYSAPVQLPLPAPALRNSSTQKKTPRQGM